jgi:transcriptional regulator with GAF, ATPase, and Fis domain
MDQQISLQQQNRELSDALKRSADELSAVAAVATTISQSLDLGQTLNTALAAVLSVTGAKAGGISMIDEETNEVVLKAQKGWVKDFVYENPMRFPVGKGLSGHVILNDTVFLNNHLDESLPLAVNSFHDEKFRSIVMVPMHARGRVVGILSIMSTIEDAFDEGHVSVMKNVADAVGVALDNARLYETTQEGQRSLSAVLQSACRCGRRRWRNVCARRCCSRWISGWRRGPSRFACPAHLGASSLASSPLFTWKARCAARTKRMAG